MDYNKEVNMLTSMSTSFKPTAGSYRIAILSEPTEAQYVDDKGVATPQIKVEIEVDKERKSWFISKCKSHSGLFGQLMLIGQAKGKLIGQAITLLVKRGNNKNEYTIVEAVDLIKGANKK